MVNADDFGLSPGVNRGVVEAHERGVVTSASLMVRQPGSADAAALARTHPDLAVGLHVDLGEWAYRGGAWVAVYRVTDEGDAAAVAAELARQLAAFEVLVGRRPTHLDSHQHVHREGPLAGLLSDAGARLGVPVRHRTPWITHVGDFYGQLGTGEPLPGAVSAQALAALVRQVPPGVTELACHPGYDDGLDTMYRAERALEVAALCDPRVRHALVEAGVELRSFADLLGSAAG